ncbi:ABC transporter ATP-binding protein [Geobacter sp. AOG1]|uniref:ABC transporter ATP-binding protein n=1 Tax=Geobacter sp. AOG1 TaxID=1566346 RepID=UPI001CC634C1|nr:ABC transporter ATP-binding protein [Geobacter sp. AOG1]
MRSRRGTYLLGGLFLLGTNSCALLIPWLMKLAVEGLQFPLKAPHSSVYYALLIIAAALLQGIIRIFSRTTLLHAARRIEFQLREELYAKLLDLDLPYFSRERTGDILSRFSNDLTNVRMLMGFGVLNVINTVIIYVAALFLMVRISPSLTAFAIIPFPLMILIVKRLSASMFRRSKRAQEELARLSSHVEENVSAAAVVRAYCREAAQIDAFREINSRYLESNMGMARLRGWMIPVMASAGAFGTLIVLFLGGSRVIAGTFTLGDFVAFNGYLAMLIWPTIVMGWILNLMQRGAASMSRLNHVLEARGTVTEPTEPAPVERLRGEIEFRNLAFSYGDEPFLADISLTIKPGMKVGIAGPVGSGKSSLVRLIPRLYPVADGRLFLDGIDVNRIPLARLRDAIGFVPQESFLFSRSIRDNIGYGKEDAAPEEIATAARLASLENDVHRFPDGYDTLVGERGVTLSGGQKQRAAIARALLKDSAILILDDPLSAVDSRTEEEILGSLGGYYGDRTVIIVSHRLSALRECDLILVLEAGRVVEQGSHEDLLAMGGRYAATWHEQQLRAEIERL